jgi:hypothetical protein
LIRIATKAWVMLVTVSIKNSALLKMLSDRKSAAKAKRSTQAAATAAMSIAATVLSLPRDDEVIE